MIEFREVEKRYPNGYEALRHINLTIDQGEFVAIIGLSGAGKSTLIRTINRMHDITQGELTVDGTDVMSLHGKSLRKFRRKIGMIFQSFNLITRTTVIKNVLTAFVPDLPWWRATLGIFTKDEKMKALEALDQMGILDKAFVRADQLSGGQQQRVGSGPDPGPGPPDHPGRRAGGLPGPGDRQAGHGRFPADQPGDAHHSPDQHPPCGAGAPVRHPGGGHPGR